MLPGDTLQLQMHTFVRMATPLNPVLDNLYLDSFFFFCPIRILWENFKRMMGEQDKPSDSISFLVPQMTSPGTDLEQQSLSDYLGIPPVAINLVHSSLWHRMYARCWNDWFRDENMQDSIVSDTDDGPDTYADYVLQRRGKRKDYFTGCLTAAQKGPEVKMPLGTVAPVIPRTASAEQTYSKNDAVFFKLTGTAATTNLDLTLDPVVSGAIHMTDTQLDADLTNATAATINQLRESFAIQALLEMDARGGSRYVESIRMQWGVTSPDARLQRTEFLGGGSQNISVTPVPVTTQNPNADVGDLGAYAISSGSNHSFIYSATEHGCILGLVSVRADLNYQRGLNRMLSRRSRYDFYNPIFAHLGEQEVLGKEIWCDAAGVGDSSTFGFQERWAEYRYGQSMITGTFRSDATLPLDVWHLAQDLTIRPVLGDTFIKETPPIARVVITVTEPHFLGDFYFSMKHSRVMPTFSVPGLGRRL